MIENSKAWCCVKQTTRQSLPWSIYCFSMEGKRWRKRKSRPQRVVGEGMGTAHLFPWHQLNVQCNNSLVCYFPSGRIHLSHLRSVFNLKLFLLQSCFVNPSGRSLTSDTFLSIRKIRKAAGRNWWEAIPGHRGGPRKLHSCGHRDSGFPKSGAAQAGLPAGPSWGGNQCHGDTTLVMPHHSHSSQLSFITIYKQPSGQGFPYWCSWKPLAFPQHWKQGYGGHLGKNLLVFINSNWCPPGQSWKWTGTSWTSWHWIADFEETEVKGILVSTWQAWK